MFPFHVSLNHGVTQDQGSDEECSDETSSSEAGEEEDGEFTANEEDGEIAPNITSIKTEWDLFTGFFFCSFFVYPSSFLIVKNLFFFLCVHSWGWGGHDSSSGEGGRKCRSCRGTGWFSQRGWGLYFLLEVVLIHCIDLRFYEVFEELSVFLKRKASLMTPLHCCSLSAFFKILYIWMKFHSLLAAPWS